MIKVTFKEKPVLRLSYDSNYEQVLPDMCAEFVCHCRQIIYIHKHTHQEQRHCI
jgi:hypothetical protein